jgi:3'-phosphoadenosine 5'-phosphosulfate sulfotransferase (PAPS reductase)/FAD synthetase
MSENEANRKMIYHVGVSGGKDSSALLLWAIHESGIPRESLRVTFCDTGNEDTLTYDHIELLRKIAIEAGVPGGIETLTPPLQFFDLALKKRRFPSRKAQFCTIELKIRPTKDWLRRQWDAGFDVEILNGKRIGESAERARSMKDKPERAFSDYWGCVEWSPLRDWSIDDVLAIHRRHKVPLNPLYALGAKRVGCWPCINCGKLGIRLVAKHRPEKIDYIAAQERRHQDENGRFSTFFPAQATTPNFHDVTYVRAKDGKEFGAASIRKVVEWAQTERGGRQLRLELDEPKACFIGYMACE